jgi:hypothetical protein
MAWSDVLVVLCAWLALVLWSLYAATWKDGVPVVIGSRFDGDEASDESDGVRPCADGDENEDACREPYEEPTRRAKCD